MKRRNQTAGVIREIETYNMSKDKPSESAIRQQNHEPFKCDFKYNQTESKLAITYLSEKCNIKTQIPSDSTTDN